MSDHSAEKKARVDGQRACLVCRHVLTGERPVLIISCGGGDFQALCDRDDHDFDLSEPPSRIEDATVVHISHILEMDCSVEEIFQLPIDWAARRSSRQDRWVWFHSPDIEDNDTNA
jgi:hypothetical protein